MPRIFRTTGGPRARLTLNLGVRYEYYTPVKEQNGLALLPQLAAATP